MFNKLIHSRAFKVNIAILLMCVTLFSTVQRRYSAAILVPVVLGVTADALLVLMANASYEDNIAAAEAFGSEVMAYLDFRKISIDIPTPSEQNLLDKFIDVTQFCLWGPRGTDDFDTRLIIPSSFVYDNPVLCSLYYTLLKNIQDNGRDCFRTRVLALPLNNDIIKAFDEYFGYSVPEKIETITHVENTPETVSVEAPVYEYVPTIPQSNINDYQSAMRNIDAFSSRFWNISTDSFTEIWDDDTSSWHTVSYDYMSPVFPGAFYPNSIVFSVDNTKPLTLGHYFTATVYANEILMTDVHGGYFGSYLPDDVKFSYYSTLPYYLSDLGVTDIFQSDVHRLYYAPPYTFGVVSDVYHDAYITDLDDFTALIQNTLKNYVNIRIYVLPDLSDLTSIIPLDDWIEDRDLFEIDVERRNDTDVVTGPSVILGPDDINDTNQIFAPGGDGLNVPAHPDLDTDDTVGYYLPDLIDLIIDNQVDVGDKIINAINNLYPNVGVTPPSPVVSTVDPAVPDSGDIFGFPFTPLSHIWEYVDYLFNQGLAFVQFATQSFLAVPVEIRWLLYGTMIFVSLAGFFRRMLG